MADDKDPWDEMVKDNAPKEVGMSPDMARRLLEMNPSLRGKGYNTVSLINQSQQAALGQKPQTPQSKAGAAPATKPQSSSVVETLKLLGRKLADEERQLDLEISGLHQKKQKVKGDALEGFVRWLENNDPELRSPFTQEVLQAEKPLLDKLGFSLKAYVERRRGSGNSKS